ncbi:MAG: 16S rRNA processing protein RimM [Limnobacter sp.]|nr:16S rRNA processing protein RimM [Limnobacter sp.]
MSTGRPVVVGRIVGSYGVRGWLRIEPFNDPNESVLLTARRWLFHRPALPGTAMPGDRASRPGLPTLPAEFEVLRCKVQGDILLAAVEGVDAKEVADTFRGCEVAVDRSEFPPAGDDEFYWVDLIGCLVATPDGVELGLVEGLDDHGAHPLLRVRDPQGRERLIPFVSTHVPEVDVPARRIVADWDPDF